jgi:hypothetical protein
MSKRSLIDSIEVKKACSEDWNAMTGNERLRFCSHCNLSVNNLSALTRKQALRLVRESNGGICVRYVKNPVDNTPVFAGKLYQITRRAGLAAGVLGATLAVSTLAFAQGKPALNKMAPRAAAEEVVKENETDETAIATGSVSGMVTDEMSAVVPNISVTLTAKDGKFSVTAATDEQGLYRFENLADDNYLISYTGKGWKNLNVNLTVSSGKEVVFNPLLAPADSPESLIVMGDVAIIEYKNSLFKAVSSGDFKAVENIIANGENINAKDENYSNITPLFLAVENGSAEIAETLLNFGAKINARDDNRQTPLMRLDEDASAELVNLLIKHGARVNLVDKDGNTALILASRSVNIEVLQILITRSANIDARSGAGRTALMEAADADNLENVRILLAAGADASLKDNDGETAFDLTTDGEIKKLLESYGAESTEEDSQ